MFSLRYLRDNHEQVGAGLAAKGYPADALNEVLELDRQRRQVLVKQEQLRHIVRSTSRAIGPAASSAESAELIAKTRAASAELGPLDDQLAKSAGNLTTPSWDYPTSRMSPLRRAGTHPKTS